MQGLLKTVKNLLTYKERKNEEWGFELLEDENEGVEQENNQNTSTSNNNQKENTQNQKGKPGITPLKIKKSNESKKNENVPQPQNNADTVANQLSANLDAIKQKFGMPKNQDIAIREFKIGRKIKAFIVYISGMADKQTLNLSIFPQLMSKDIVDELGEECPVDYLMENVLTIHSVTKAKEYKEIILQVLNGVSALFVEGCSECILIETRGYEKRSVDQPITETVVIGSQEGLTENLRTNLTLIRKIVKNEKLMTEMLPIGNTNNSDCAIMYLEGIANPKVIQEVKKRIKKINTDFVFGAGMVEQFIEDNPFMLFEQVLTTERSDRAASFIMEGQVLIIADGTPFAITVPVTFFRLFHTSEDSFLRWPFGNFLRFIRLFGLFCATLLPGLYTALVLYHPEMIPTELLASIAKAKETVPFPTVIEVLIMEVSFELIREGGIRVPSVIGQTLGIVGALILGQAAVTAGLVSPILIIIVSVTGLGSFAIPNYSLGLAIRIERFLFIFAGAAFGFYGISLVVFLLAISACSMKSFGVPFFSPAAPRTKVNPDVSFKAPIWMQKNRPDAFNTPDRKRQGDNVKNWSSEKDPDKNGG